MARNDITDGSHRAGTDTGIATVELADGDVVVYDRDNADAWIHAETTTELTEVR